MRFHLTLWRSFDVISFANSAPFRIGRDRRHCIFIDMRLNDEFYFALAERIHTILISPQTSNQPQTLQRLNKAHPDLNLDPLLAWRLPFRGARVD